MTPEQRTKARAAQARYRARNLEKRRADTRERMARARAENPERLKKANDAYRKRHPDRVNARERARYARNPQRKLAACARYRKERPEQYAAYVYAWNKANPHKRRAIEQKRNLRHRTPAWADYAKIAEMYELARLLTLATGIPHEVDHYYPLNGRNVSGLHVETNLQILTREENRRKNNKSPA